MPALWRSVRLLSDEHLDLPNVMGGEATPGNGTLVVFDRHPVNLDRPLDCLKSNGTTPF